MRSTLLLLAVLSVGCVKSSDVKTSALKATFSAVANGEGKTHYRATLAYSNNGFSTSSLILSDSDKLSVTVNGQTTSLSNGFELIQTSPAAGSTIEFTLKRPNETVTSSVVLPDDFSVSSDQAGQTLSLAQDNIGINASPAAATGDSVTWSASGVCINSINENAADKYGATISAGTVTMPSEDPSQSCTMTVTLFRTHSGTPSTSFAAGSAITATQSRELDFHVTP